MERSGIHTRITDEFEMIKRLSVATKEGEFNELALSRSAL
jgi:hypothetical protein